MPRDESASRGNYVIDPRYRADCADFYCEPHETARIDFRGPEEVVQAIEECAKQCGRTWNKQLAYLYAVCRGEEEPSPEDRRTASDWRTLMAQMEMRFNEGEEWFSCSVIFKAEHQAMGSV